MIPNLDELLLLFSASMSWQSYLEGFSHLFLSALCRFLKLETSMEDSLTAKDLAAQLFLDIVGGFVNHDNRIVEKIFGVFDVQLANLENLMSQDAKNDCSSDMAQKFFEQYILKMIESESYLTAVTLLEHFSIRRFGKSFFLNMIQSRQLKAAEKWAAFIGKPMLCVLVHEYIGRDMLQHAKKIMQKYNFRKDFPDVYRKYERSLLKQLAEKGCWEVAEARTKGSRHLIEYLVCLAVEAENSEKVDELCDRYSLKGLLNPEVSEPNLHCVQFDGLPVEDKAYVFSDAICHNEESKVIVALNSKQKAYFLKGGRENVVSTVRVTSGKTWKPQTRLSICKHCFSNLKHVSPMVFIYILKECYSRGRCKARKKFQVLLEWIHLVLHNDPQPGRATFVVQCLYILLVFGLQSDGFSQLIISAFCRFPKSEITMEGFSQLIISAFCRFPKSEITMEDSMNAKDLAAQLFLNIVGGLNYDDGVIENLCVVFGVQMKNIVKVMHQNAKNGCSLAQMFVEQYIFKLIESESCMTAVTLLEHFSIRKFGKSFLLSMIQTNQLKAAEKWATFMGKPMLCILGHEYIDRNKLNNAKEVMQKNNFKQEFPDVYRKYKESLLKKFAEKGCWDVAEARTDGNCQLLEYLVYLANEAGYTEKVNELCDRYSINCLSNAKVPKPTIRYLRLNELAVEDIVWVDKSDALHDATCHIEEYKVVGLDCEWKPNYEKGGKENNVSIMQLASGKIVFILDMIKLFEDVPDVLDNCLSRIFQSTNILKLGYAFKYDARHLADSYGELKCFNHYKKLLDIRHLFEGHVGGLSGLAQKILGFGLNKTRRNSNWEQRPLTPNQLEYAAIDAAVLLRIFEHVRSQPQVGDGMMGKGMD